MNMEQQAELPDVDDAPVIETQEAPASDAQEAQEAPEQSAAQDEARKYGWAPKDAWRGDPDKWKDAGAFLELAQNNVPMLRSKVDKQAAELERKQQEFQDRIDRLEKVSRVAVQRQKADYEARIAVLTTQEERAVEMGDLEAWKAVKAERDRLGAAPEVPEAKQDQHPSQRDPASPAKIAAWKAQNPWFDADPAMQRAALAASEAHWSVNPQMTLEDNLSEVARVVRTSFPDRFKAQGMGRTNGDGAPAPARKTLASQLPPEDRRVGERFVKDGLFKSIEDYAKDYFA